MNNNSFDINVRTLDFHNRKIEIHYVSSLCSDELIAYLVEGITNAKGKTLKERARELIKINVLQNCADDPNELAQIVAERTHSQVVQVIGKKIVLYKESKNKKKIELPPANKKN